MVTSADAQASPLTVPDALEHRRIDLLRFPLACLVVLIHALEEYVDYASGPVQLPFTPWMHALVVWIRDIVALIAVPGFFAISGYLLFRDRDLSFPTWRRRVLSRWRRFGGPYLVWNGLMVAIYGLGQLAPATGKYFSGRLLPLSEWTLPRVGCMTKSL
jgi:peptidoglycan/LPS O-acetylase OafA/YrhL